MEIHERIDNFFVLQKLIKEIDDIKGIKFESIIFHAFVGYYIDELIRVKFSEPKEIIDNNVFGTVYKKHLILKALNIFGKLDIKDKLDLNIITINRIRNHYAHNLIMDESIPEKIMDYIKQLTLFDYPSLKIVDSTSSVKTQKEYERRYYRCTVSTIFALHKIVNDLRSSK